MEIVSALRSALADRVGKERLDLWFGPRTRIDWDGRRLVIRVPNQFFEDWLRTRFRGHIEHACLTVLGAVPELEFLADSGLNGAHGLKVLVAEPCPAESPPDSVPAIASGSPPAEPPAPLKRRFADLDSYVVGECNRLAHAAAARIARRPGELTPMTVYGPTGVGKTHLLEGIWTAARRHRRDLSAVYLSAEQFTTYFVQALRGSGLPAFRQKYRGVDLLILDDLHFFSGKRQTQVEVLYTVDALLRAGRQVICAADRSPAELGELGPELISRLQSGMVCPIEPPDHPTRLGIVGSLARRMQLHLPPDVQELVASRFTSHARELSGAICRLAAAAEAWREPVTLKLAQQTLSGMCRQHAKLVRLSDIEKAVCQTFGLEAGSLQSGRRAKDVSHPRMLAMWLARKYTRSALSEIGHYFGRRSHSTVISAQKRIDDWLSQGQSLSLADRDWGVQDAIRQVERRIEAG